ncbi:hypothetical protein [Agromyces humatus]|nr:hypothetical protein [Agromyces humatus]
MDDDLIATEPDCPVCGTRTIWKAGRYICRSCAVSVIEQAPEASDGRSA